MNTAELLNYIFNGVAGEFLAWHGPEEVETSTANLSDAASADMVEMRLLADNTVLGVQTQDASIATFCMTSDDDVQYFVLFDTPIDEARFPESVGDFLVPIAAHWRPEIITDTFYTFEAVFGTSTGVTISDIGEEDAKTEVEVAELDRDEAGSVSGGNAEIGGGAGSAGVPLGNPVRVEPSNAADHTGPVAPERTDHAAEQRGELDRADVPSLNDAELLGASSDAMQALLAQPATLLTGALWGTRDTRNTQDGDWTPVTMPWLAWITGGKAAGKGSSDWGFSNHPVGKSKEGQSIVLGSSIGQARKAKAMEYMFAMGLDIDSGASLDDVLAKLEKLGLFCIVYTSFNHGKRGLQLKRDDVLRKLKITSDPSLLQIQQYLREFDKSRYEEDFIARCTIRSAKKQVKDGVVIELDTPPLDKFRLIFPLAEKVKLIDLAETQEAALEVWEDKITGLARELLGVHFDTSCTDPSRLFYTGRHPKDAADWYCAVVQGAPLKFYDVPTYKKSRYTAKRDNINPFEMAGEDLTVGKSPMTLTPSGRSLNEWHTTFKSRFMIANLLEDYCGDKLVRDGTPPQGSVFLHCPFETEHTSEGGTGTMATNCIDSSSEYWTIHCKHDACQGRHKTQFLEEMLRQGWFEEDVIYDLDAGYLLEAEDPEIPAEVIYEGDLSKSPADLADEFNKDSSELALKAFVQSQFDQGVDLAVQANITAILARNTNIGKREIKNFWKECSDEARKAEKEKEKDGGSGSDAGIINEWDFRELCEYGHRRIHDTNRKKPTVFHYMESLHIIRTNSEGHAKMKSLGKEDFAHHLNTVAKYARVSGEEKMTMTGVSAPLDVVSHLFTGDYGVYPELRGLATTPIFTKSGGLLTKPGYDMDSRLYYHPDTSMSLPKVSATPTEAEVTEAKRLLTVEVFADFPFGGLSRDEIIEGVMGGDSVPAVANMFALLLLPFMREMVDGPTPGHLLQKSTPGTGASLLTDAFSIIATGRATPALAMPTNKDEMSKTLTSILSNGQSIVFFDNINHAVDSGELASAMTAPTYQARILGKSQTIEVDVRVAWVLTGNNVKLSSELVRRLILINLNAKMANPEMRTGFRHSDIRGWVTENRGKCVWACLTLIQNYIAKGRVVQNEDILASYENWSRVVGGVLKASNINGFLQNKEELREKADDSESDDIILFLEAWWHKYANAPVILRDKEAKQGLIDLVIADDLSIPLRVVRNADGDSTYNVRQFGEFLGKYSDRVFELEDGTEVTVTKVEGRTSVGNRWQLLPNKRVR